MKNIFLIGFMGTGKTTVSSALKEISGMEVVDTDEELVKIFGMSIPEVFEKLGEARFREEEHTLIKMLATGEGEAKIISCGGGVILREDNRNLMKEGGKVCLLTAKPETILERVKYDNNRPLLVGRKTVEGITELLNARQANYDKAKDFEVATDGRPAKEIAEEILSNMN